MKKILVINGHPNKKSFSGVLSEAYAAGARQQQEVEVEMLHLSDLSFDPILHFGYRQRTELEPDLIRAQRLLREADHTVWVYPTWWGGLPALLKGFIDRVFLPGFSFQYHEKGPWWDKLMKGKTARVITTMDAPNWYYRLVYGSPGQKAFKRMILGFCGYKVRFVTIGGVKNKSRDQLDRWVQRVRALGIAEGKAA